MLVLLLVSVAESRGYTTLVDNVPYQEGTRNIHYYTFTATPYPGNIEVNVDWVLDSPVTVKAVEPTSKNVVYEATQAQSPISGSILNYFGDL